MCLRGKMSEAGLLPAQSPIKAPQAEAAIANEPVTALAEPQPDLTAPAASATPVPDSLIAATFGLLRAEPDGSVVIAGSGTPGSEVEIYSNGVLLGRAKVESSGDWVLVPDQPIPPGGTELTLAEAGREGRAAQSFVVVINDDKTSEPLVVASKPGAASQVLQGLDRPRPNADIQVAANPGPVATPAPAAGSAAAPSAPVAIEPAAPVSIVVEPANPILEPAPEPETAAAESTSPAEATPASQTETAAIAPASATLTPPVPAPAEPPSTPSAPSAPAATVAPPSVQSSPATQTTPTTPAATAPPPTTRPAPTAPTAPTASPVPTAVPAPAPTPETAVAAVEPAAPTPAAPNPALADIAPTIDAIEIEGDRTFFAGSGQNRATIRLYVDGRHIADALVSDGRWLIEAGNVLTAPSQRVRIDMLKPGSADVVARAEVDFVVDLPRAEAPVAVAQAPEPAPGSVPTTTPTAPVVAPFAPAIAVPPRQPVAVAEPGTPAAPVPNIGDQAPAMANGPATPSVAPSQPPAAVQAPAASAPTIQLPASETVVNAAPASRPTEPAQAAPVPTQSPAAVAQPASPAVVPEPAPSDVAAAQDEVPTMVAVAVGDPEAQRFVSGKAIIRHGDNLWTIARRVYGAGIKYTTIYEANNSQIRDPDRIYPGQVFDLPEDKN